MGQPVPSAAPRQLVGRASELARIDTFLAEAFDGGAALLLVGDPGVGKTALLDAAARRAEASGALVLQARGAEFLDHVPFAGLQQVVLPMLSHPEQRISEAHRSALDVAFGVGRGARPQQLVVFNATLQLIRATAADQPVLLVLDDLQWLDEASRAALLFVARRLAGSRVGVLAAVRTGEADVRTWGIPAAAVPPLEADAAAQLLGERFPGLTARSSQRVLAEARGNPLAILELPLALSTAHPAVGSVLAPAPPLTRRLQSAYAARLAALPRATRTVLLLAALDATPDSPLHIDADAPRAIAPAEMAGLVTHDPVKNRIVFAHPLVRASVVASATDSERRAAHRELALREVDDPDARIWHMAQATAEPDAGVAEALSAAARRRLLRGDPVGATRMLLRAASLSDDPPGRAARLAEAAYISADVTGDLAEARLLLAEARNTDPATPSSLTAALSMAYLLLNGDGNVGAAFRVLTDALDRVVPEGPTVRVPPGDPHLLTEAAFTLLEVCLYGGRPDMWAHYDRLAGRLGVAVPQQEQLVVSVLSDPARTSAQQLSEIERAVLSLDAETDPTRIERVATAALFLDRATDCRPALRRVIDDGRDGGAIASAINALMVLCIDDVMVGQWAEAHELAREGLALSHEHGYSLLSWPFHLGQGLLAASRGHDSEVATLAARIDQWAGSRGAEAVRYYARLIQARAAATRDDPETCYAHAAAISAAGQLADYVPVALWAVWDLVQSAVDTGRHADAARHVAACRDAGLHRLSPRLALVTDAAAALVAPRGEARELFEQALSVHGRQRWPFDLARVELAFGSHLRRVHDDVSARDHLTSAVDLFARLGADPWQRRAAAELRAAGQPVTVAAAAGEPLTLQELTIAQLAASGNTNRQIGAQLFLSHRTVGGHLRRVFSKLGVTSRAALADALARRAAALDTGDGSSD